MIVLLVAGLLATCLAQVDVPSERIEVDPDDCLAFNGLLPDEDRPGGDCCHFIACDSSDFNKTGFRQPCIYPLVWNREIPACDEDTNVAGACIHSTCSMTPEPRPVCESDAEVKATLGADYCCIEGEDGIYQHLPEYGEEYYQFRWLAGEFPEFTDEDVLEGKSPPLKCPAGQKFSTEDCCCETEQDPDPNCEFDIYFQLPSDNCCQYHQCFTNKTGFWDVTCMGAVWNQKILNCDDPSLVPGCENDPCIAATDMTEKPCPPSVGGNQCCIHGVIYTKDEDDPFEDGGSFYIGEIEFDNLQFCPSGQSFELECCCCYGMANYAPECDCIEYSFEPFYERKDQLQNTSIDIGSAVITTDNVICGSQSLLLVASDVVTIDYFARRSLGREFTFSFAADGSNLLISNGNPALPATFEVSLSGGITVDISINGQQVTLSGGTGTYYTIVKTLDSVILYVDSGEADSVPIEGSVDTTDCPLKFEGFDGILDSIVLCDFSYSPTQVQELTSCRVNFDPLDAISK